jgi:hypothetical protein
MNKEHLQEGLERVANLLAGQGSVKKGNRIAAFGRCREKGGVVFIFYDSKNKSLNIK